MFLVFLNANRLRLLWASLVGTFYALGVVLEGKPSRRSYQFTKSDDELRVYAIRSTLTSNLKDLGSTIIISNNNYYNYKNDATITTTNTEFSTTITNTCDPPKVPIRKEIVNGSEVTTSTQQRQNTEPCLRSCKNTHFYSPSPYLSNKTYAQTTKWPISIGTQKETK
ncbi:hypothetical protein IV203_010953 [Nitzschia inconspicua]|uniref:Uncharacterized protein n=1 Tax=Nitzschia inconspicua TaxID=303405 RepID=A0A9K3KXE4_9STRA|nr:hypothetical protein IV203_010953 [Nitzschia inconspicua]